MLGKIAETGGFRKGFETPEASSLGETKHLIIPSSPRNFFVQMASPKPEIAETQENSLTQAEVLQKAYSAIVMAESLNAAWEKFLWGFEPLESPRPFSPIEPVSWKDYPKEATALINEGKEVRKAIRGLCATLHSPGPDDPSEKVIMNRLSLLLEKMADADLGLDARNRQAMVSWGLGNIPKRHGDPRKYLENLYWHCSANFTYWISGKNMGLRNLVPSLEDDWALVLGRNIAAPKVAPEVFPPIVQELIAKAKELDQVCDPIRKEIAADRGADYSDEELLGYIAHLASIQAYSKTLSANAGSIAAIRNYDHVMRLDQIAAVVSEKKWKEKEVKIFEISAHGQNDLFAMHNELNGEAATPSMSPSFKHRSRDLREIYRRTFARNQGADDITFEDLPNDVKAFISECEATVKQMNRAPKYEDGKLRQPDHRIFLLTKIEILLDYEKALQGKYNIDFENNMEEIK